MNRMLVLASILVLLSCDTKEYENIEMVFVEGGTFLMGGIESDNEDLMELMQEEFPVHEVTVNDFYIGKYEVTQAQWKSIMGSNPASEFWKNLPYKEKDLPIANISWNDVQIFIKKLNEKTGKQYRLPTEAEWEFAARGGSKSLQYKYCSGSNDFNEASWLRPNSDHIIHPVGTKKANELGVFDMTGNVWEWCQDYYGKYDSCKQINPMGPIVGNERVTRGGGALDAQILMSIARRDGDEPDFKYGTIGFRLACDIVKSN